MHNVSMINRLCLIGVGLIGGSLVRALRKAGVVGEIVGCDRNEASLQRAVELGVIDRYVIEVSEAVRGADMIVLAVPVGSMQAIFSAIVPVADEDAVITDVGSTKASVVEAAINACGGLPVNFVPGHPIAGTERSGVEASFADLYQRRRVILTPLADTNPVAIEKVRAMWQATGAEVESMEVHHHDEVLAATSHLPHVLAFGLVDSLARMEDTREIFRYAAGGFRDFTRIASSDPKMWADICLANRNALMQILSHFAEDLAGITEAINKGDGDYLLTVFERAKAARDRFCETA
jgi:prephenate dehydrogenase